MPTEIARNSSFSRAIKLPSRGELIAGCSFLGEAKNDPKNRRVWFFECRCGFKFKRLASQQRHYHKNNRIRLCGQTERHASVNIGGIYGKWKVVGFEKVPAWCKEKGNYLRTKAICLCSCGNQNTKLVMPYNLINGDSRSCGCYRLQRLSEAKTTHGLSNTQQQYMWSQAKGRAKKNGIAFDLEIDDCVIPEFCPLLRIRIKKTPKGKKVTGNIRQPNSPSLDRIDPSKGYTKDNVWVISWRANDLKRDGTLTEFKKIVEALDAISI